MNWTPKQKEALMYKNLGKILYKEDMFKIQHQLGYGEKGSNTQYNIVVAKDCPTKEIRAIVLMHEVGHIVYRHLDVDFKKEFKNIKTIFDKLNKPYNLISKYGGPMSFLNIAMDLEVNSKLLTFGNIKTMEKYFKLCTPDSYEVETMDSFRDYYEPLIAKLEDNLDLQQIGESMSDLPSNANQGKGTGDSSFDKEFQKEVYKSSTDYCNQYDSQFEELDREEISAGNTDSPSEQTSKPGKGSASQEIEIVPNNEKTIVKFLQQIITRPEAQYQPDIMRIHNRGTKVNDQGILYSSKKRKKIQGKAKFCFIVDVSGSMYTDSILKAIGALNSTLGFVDKNSKLVTWNEDKVEEFDINSIPSKIKTGGGTDMASAVKYAKEEGYTDIVIYSDFETDMDPLAKESEKLRMYSIVVENNYNKEDCLEHNYFKSNKKMIRVR